MYPYYFNEENEAYALSADVNDAGGVVHVRLEEKDGQQARLRLTPAEARKMAERLHFYADQADEKAGKPRIRRVACSAIRDATTQEIILGARHHHCLQRIPFSKNKWRGDTTEQGFVDQRGEFMTREEALVVAQEAGQIIRRCGGDEKRLYSENLY